ncbi:MAG: hypothetical protein HYZ27_11715, partial [Deltaproteobacteria bacterium]|nr:hypothetical protein [Deltaproteobacteria bacterium]
MLLALALACSEVPQTQEREVRLCILAGLGVGFELPVDWEAVTPDSGVFAGPAHEDSAYTTVTVQAAPAREQALSDAVAAVANRLSDAPRFALLYSEPAVVDS